MEPDLFKNIWIYPMGKWLLCRRIFTDDNYSVACLIAQSEPICAPDGRQQIFTGCYLVIDDRTEEGILDLDDDLFFVLPEYIVAQIDGKSFMQKMHPESTPVPEPLEPVPKEEPMGQGPAKPEPPPDAGSGAGN